jgi:hypothetical protein
MATLRHLRGIDPRGQKLGDIMVKTCPGCEEQYVKEDDDQCDHMKCPCGKEFCWQCLADRDVIEKHGNHYHKPSCKFWCEPPTGEKPEVYLTKCKTCCRKGKPCKMPLDDFVPCPGDMTLYRGQMNKEKARRDKTPPKHTQIPASRYSVTAREIQDQSQCLICLFDFEVGDPVEESACGHIFHTACIDESHKHDSNCPICKVRGTSGVDDGIVSRRLMRLASKRLSWMKV